MTGTVILILTFNIPSTNCGFHKNMIIGALVHNLIEVYILFYIWFGSELLIIKKPNHIFYFILYVFIVSLLFLSLPVNYGAYIGLIHGFTIDYLLLFSFIYIRYRFKINENKHYTKTFCIASTSFILHIIGSLAIGGFLLQSAIVFVIGTVLLVPAFLLLTLFAIKYHKRMTFIGHKFKANDILLYDVQSKHDNIPQLERCVTLHTNATPTKGTDDDNDLFVIGALRYFKVENKAIIGIFGLSFVCSLIYSTLIWISPCFMPPSIMCLCY